MNKIKFLWFITIFLLFFDNAAAKNLSLKFQDIPVRSALQMLADFGHVNIVINDSVKGNVTLNIGNMTWQEAFDVILEIKGLDSRKVHGIIFVESADEIVHWDEATQKKQEAQAALLPLSMAAIDIKYARATELIQTLKNSHDFVSSDRGHISVDKRTNAIIVQDVPEKIEAVSELIQLLDVPVRQVLIEARIVSINRNFEKDLGIQFGMTNENISDNSGASTISDGLNVDFGAVSSLGYTPGTMGIALAKLGGGFLLDLELSALESEGEGKVISSPRLITSNQESAFIESGEEIPYQESTLSGATAVSFKKAVLRLKVTPQITSNNKVMMALSINQDMPNGILVNGVPEVSTKEIQTHVLVKNGQTLVLGGIYRQDKSQTVQRIPFLSDVPGIGSIFQKKTDKIVYEELLIFITPKIIHESP